MEYPDLLSPADRALQALLSPAMPGRADILARLDEVLWPQLEERMTDHRLLPLVNWLVRHDSQLSASVPGALRQALLEAGQAATIEALGRQHQVAALAALFAREGLRAMALKGAGIAFTHYPEPGMRSMRDVDFLFEDRDASLRAFELLLQNGFVRFPGDHGSAAASAENSHQLPPLLNEDGSHVIEIHHRLFHGDSGNGSVESGFWQRSTTLRLLEQDIVIPDAIDQFLHLVHHAARDHLFDNGPLTVSDLHFLSHGSKLDGADLMERAASFGIARETALLMEIARRAWSPSPATATEENTGEAAAWALMLADSESVRTARVHASLRKNPGSLASRLWPTPTRLSGDQGSIDNAGDYLRALARHWHLLLFRRIPAFLGRAARGDADGKLAAYLAWRQGSGVSD